MMTVTPAKIAGVRRVAVVSPPPIHPAVLAAADIAGADEVYQVGGVQAITALAWGTESIKAVDKIVGPGNKYPIAKIPPVGEHAPQLSLHSCKEVLLP